MEERSAIVGDIFPLAAWLRVDAARKLRWVDATVGPRGQAEQWPLLTLRRLLGNTPYAPDEEVREVILGKARRHRAPVRARQL